MIPCISTYSFQQLISKGEITQIGSLEKAKELGFSFVEVAHFDNGDMSLCDYARALRNEADRVGITIVNVVFEADFLNGTKGRDYDIEKEIAHAREMIDAAEIIGVKQVRHDATWSLGNYRSFEEALPVMAERIREISLYAKSKGIRTMVENHGRTIQDPERMLMLYGAVNCDNFGLLCDMGHFLCNDCDPVRAISMLAPYTFFLHAKDFYFKSGSSLDEPGRGFFKTRGANYLKGAPIGHGVVPVTQCLKIMKAAGYDSYITIEYEGAEECINAIRIAKENLEKFITNA